MKKTCIIFLLSFLSVSVRAIDLTHCTIVYNNSDAALVKKMANVLADDIERVSGLRPSVSTERASGPSIILASMGSQLATRHPELNGEWERYAIDSDKEHIYVTGSDARGLAYGVLHISESIGVSPWYWWADVPVGTVGNGKGRNENSKRKGNANSARVGLEYSENYVSKSPSVKYRGFFINDEDWGLFTWSSRNFEKELGDIGPKTYDKVCELILRLKGNMLAPAMHTITGAFYTHPESQVKAAEWGIMITTSHCEPLLVNNASKKEWDSAVDGEWNYQTNRENILKKFNKRLEETAQYENIYTTGLRGLHDEGMKGSKDPKVRCQILEQVFADQREVLERHKQRKVEDIPQIFVPYKEALDIYDAGLRVPDDITLIWPDDNYGYMKRVCNEKERQRGGRAGVYYHLSYLGTPHDNLWINTTAPLLMYEELKKAYDAGSDRYWLLNVGDIKPMELGVQMFFDMAWDFDAFNYDNVNNYQAQWLAGIIGKKYEAELQSILDTYYRLAWERKPEFMGYEIEWDSKENGTLHDTDFSFKTGTAQKRLNDYMKIAQQVTRIEACLPQELQAPFFEMLGFAVQGAYLMNNKFLYAQHNHETGSKDSGQRAKDAHQGIQELMDKYNTMLDGKWNQMMSEIPPAFRSLSHLMPTIVETPTDSFKLPKDQIHEELEGVIRFDQIKASETANLYKKGSKAGGDEKAGTFRLLKGMGKDWVVLQMGQPLDEVQDPSSLNSSHIDIPFTLSTTQDSLRIQVNTVPFWPVFYERSNRFGVSLDRCEPVVCENKIVEWSYPWKLQVLENRKDYYITLPINKKQKTHAITFIIGDPGQMIQQIRYEVK